MLSCIGGSGGSGGGDDGLTNGKILNFYSPTGVEAGWEREDERARE